MRNIAVALALVTLTTFTLAGETLGAVSGSPHDVTAVVLGSQAKFGVCSACHIPHKAAGARLWPSLLAPIIGRGEVGILCGYCHNPGSGIIADAQTNLPFFDLTPSTHGMAKVNSPDGFIALDPTLPYVNSPAAGMECTTCHNVHDNTLGLDADTPFLQDDIDQLCARCHPYRQYVDGMGFFPWEGDWGPNFGYDAAGAAPAGTGNPGSHPIGWDIFDDSSWHDNDGDGAPDPDSPIDTSAIGIVDYRSGGPGLGQWNLGAHLINGGTTWQAGNGVGCVTCHAVHGSQVDGGAEFLPNDDLLTLWQNAPFGVANGGDSPSNDLCEACHRGSISLFASAFFPNPGATGFSHPVDDYYNLDVGVIGTPGLTNPPLGTGPNDVPLICESCHMPHPAAAFDALNVQNAWDPPNAPDNSHILRDNDPNLCNNCHATQLLNHHPIGMIYPPGFAPTGGDIGDGDNVLECGDCHNFTAAHNWHIDSGVGLDPAWEPYDNGRTAVGGGGTLLDTEANRFIPNTSKECIDCHLASQTSPTNQGGGPGPFLEYQRTGQATHFMGAVDLSTWIHGGEAIDPDGEQDGSGGNFVNDPWDDDRADGSGWSRFGGADATSALLVCESCHDLEPDKNDTANRLLLWDYAEGRPNESRSSLCEGCHSSQGTATGFPHPMTGDVISKAVTMQRAGGPLLMNDWTDSQVYADQTNAPLGDTWYPNGVGSNEMSCDSCHQPHNADDVGATYILEGGATMTGVPTFPTAAYGWSTNRYAGDGSDVTPLNYETFCTLCHLSGQ